jgi:hypothetical protein
VHLGSSSWQLAIGVTPKMGSGFHGVTSVTEAVGS